MKVLLDANVILRFVLDDHPDLYARAAALFGRATSGELQLLIPTAILAECVDTLKSFYKLGRAEIARGLLAVLSLPGVSALEESAMREALRLFGERSVDFADAYLAALGLMLDLPVATFDRDIGKLGAGTLDP